MNKISKLIICSLLGLLIWSCKKEKNFSTTPEIEVREFFMTSDTSAVWVIGFKDGDGDIGVKNQNETEANFPTQIYVIDQGQVVYDTAGQGYRVPVIEGVQTENGIEGEIRLNLTGLDLFKISGIDSLYYSGFLIDRSGKSSNVIETPIISLN